MKRTDEEEQKVVEKEVENKIENFNKRKAAGEVFQAEGIRKWNTEDKGEKFMSLNVGVKRRYNEICKTSH